MNPDVLPLAGLRVVVTRPAAGAGELEERLQRAGAVPVLIPLTAILPPEDDAPLRRARADIASFDWVVFTSSRAVRAIAGGRPWPAGRPRIAAVGLATAAEVRASTGRDPDVVPARGSGREIVPAMLEQGPLDGARVLWPRAELPRPELPRDLAVAGAVLEDPVAYRTVPDVEAGSRLARMAAAGELDVITFTAPSAVECFATAATRQVRCVVAVIGPATAAAARARGLPVHVEPRQPGLSALVAALTEFHQRGLSQDR